MKALLLNSGVGQRMGELTAEKPKCMAEIGGGYTVIGWQLTLLSRSGIRETVITTGPFPELLKSHVDSLGLDMEIRYVENPRYRETNYIYSMYQAREWLHDDILLLHGDMVLEKSVLEDLMRSGRSVAAVEMDMPLPEKDFKAKLEGGKISAIGIEFFGEDCVASQPAYRFLRKDFERWMEEICAFCEEGIDKVYAENAFNRASAHIPLYPLPLNGRLCNEVDNAQDLQAVSERFRQTLGQ